MFNNEIIITARSKLNNERCIILNRCNGYLMIDSSKEFQVKWNVTNEA